MKSSRHADSCGGLAENYVILVFRDMTAKLRTAQKHTYFVVYKLNLTPKLNTKNAVRKQSLECLGDETKKHATARGTKNTPQKYNKLNYHDP